MTTAPMEHQQRRRLTSVVRQRGKTCVISVTQGDRDRGLALPPQKHVHVVRDDRMEVHKVPQQHKLISTGTDTTAEMDSSVDQLSVSQQQQQSLEQPYRLPRRTPTLHGICSPLYTKQRTAQIRKSRRQPLMDSYYDDEDSLDMPLNELNLRDSSLSDDREEHQDSRFNVEMHSILDCRDDDDAAVNRSRHCKTPHPTTTSKSTFVKKRSPFGPSKTTKKPTPKKKKKKKTKPKPSTALVSTSKPSTAAPQEQTQPPPQEQTPPNPRADDLLHEFFTRSFTFLRKVSVEANEIANVLETFSQTQFPQATPLGTDNPWRDPTHRLSYLVTDLAKVAYQKAQQEHLQGESGKAGKVAVSKTTQPKSKAPTAYKPPKHPEIDLLDKKHVQIKLGSPEQLHKSAPGIVKNDKFRVRLDKWQEWEQQPRQQQQQASDSMVRQGNKVSCSVGLLPYMKKELQEVQDLNIKDDELRAVMEWTANGHDVSTLFPAMSISKSNLMDDESLDGLSEELSALEAVGEELRQQLNNVKEVPSEMMNMESFSDDLYFSSDDDDDDEFSGIMRDNSSSLMGLAPAACLSPQPVVTTTSSPIACLSDESTDSSSPRRYRRRRRRVRIAEENNQEYYFYSNYKPSPKQPTTTKSWRTTVDEFCNLCEDWMDEMTFSCGGGGASGCPPPRIPRNQSTKRSFF